MKILLLSCFLLCSAFIHAADEEVILSEESREDRLVFNTVRDLFDALVRASKVSVETLKELLNSDGVSDFINKLTGTAKRAALRILDYFRNKFGIESKPVAFDNLDFIRKLGEKLAAAARVGRDALKQVLEDSKILETINNMSGRVKHLALATLNHFKQLLARMSVEEASYSILPRWSEKLQEIKDLIKLVVEGQKRGTSLKDIVKSAEFKEAVEKLREVLKERIADAIERRRGGTANTYFAENLLEIMKMYQHFLHGNRRDKIEIMNFFESAEGKALVQALPEDLRKEVDDLLTTAFKRFRNELANEGTL